MATDFLDQKRAEIGERLRELEPLVAEYKRLETAMAALEDVPSPSAKRVAPARPAPARRPATANGNGNGPSQGARRGRPKGSGKRARQALEVITDHPGITIPELARRMGIKQNYLYRVLPGLEEERRIRKEGRGWHPEHGG